MKHILLILCLIACQMDLRAQSPRIDSLRQCVEEKGMPAKEYLFKCFETADIVVLGERDHRDSVQYDFILDVLADPRFAREIGYVYTEVGSQNMTPAVNRLLQGNYPTEAAFMDSLYAYYPNEIFYPLWEKYNRVKFLRGIYRINRSSRQKITLGLSDARFSWDNIHTPEDYRTFWTSPAASYRDSTMCAHIAEMYARQTPRMGKRKALVITNQPHAVNGEITDAKRPYHTQGRWMKRTFGEERVKIVMLNWFDYTLFDFQNFSNCPLTDDGNWDAAFELLDCQPFGIDLPGTPYGETPFLGEWTERKRWQDVADGLIYDAPVYDHMAAWGIEGIVTDDFKPELLRRCHLYDKALRPEGTLTTEQDLYQEYDTLRTYPAIFKSREEVRQLIREKLE